VQCCCFFKIKWVRISVSTIFRHLSKHKNFIFLEVLIFFFFMNPSGTTMESSINWVGWRWAHRHTSPVNVSEFLGFVDRLELQYGTWGNGVLKQPGETMQLAQRKGNVLTSLYYYCVVLAMLQIDFVDHESSGIKI